MKLHCIVCAEIKLKPVLDGLNDREYGVAGFFAFDQCPACGLMMLSPQPSCDVLKSYYPADYHGFNVAERGIISLLYRLVYLFRFQEYINLIGKKGKILDVGCADAPYFDLLKRKYPQLELTGIEFKDEIAEKGRKKGRNIITGTIMDLNITESYDLIIMNNLIEHVLGPVKEIQKAHSLLKDGGYILLETPNTDCWDYSITKKYWGSLHVPRHTFLFTPLSIDLLAKKTGFKVTQKKYLLGTDNWALSIQNYFQSKKHFRCAIKNGRAWYYKYLLILFIPFCSIQLLFGKTGAVVAKFQKLPY